NALSFEVTKDETEKLKTLALEAKSTLFITLLTLFNILLSKLGGIEELVVGTPTSGRGHVDLEKIVGMFVNTLALKNYPSGTKTFNAFLTEVKSRTLEAFAHQDYPYEELVEAVGTDRNTGRNPLFDTMFVLQDTGDNPGTAHTVETPNTANTADAGELPNTANTADAGELPNTANTADAGELPNTANTADAGDIPGVSNMTLPGFILKTYDNAAGVSKFDLTLSANEDHHHGNLMFTLKYCRELFKEKTINGFAGYFKNILSAVLARPDITLAKIEIISAEEKRLLLVDFNDTGADYPTNKTIHGLFEEQVEKTPDHAAVVSTVYGSHQPGTVEAIHESPFSAPLLSNSLTYRELDEKSGHLAYRLQTKGVAPGSIVGILTERSIDMAAGIIGIMKAGAAYLPLNPRNPGLRTTFMLEDCNAKVLLTSPALSGEILFEGEIISLEETADKSVSLSSAADYAYIIYTSGSTGKPKGVPITHANISPLLFWGYEHLAPGVEDRALQNLSYFFDWSVWELFITLTTGAPLYMVPDDLLLNAEACGAFIRQHGLTILHATPTQWQHLLTASYSPHEETNLSQRGAPISPGDIAADDYFESLRYLFIGAETLTYELVIRSIERVEESCRIFNMYGPTEATIISAVLEIDKSLVAKYKHLSSVPIGKPVGNTKLLVLDKYMNPCPKNISGDLYITGDNVASGYLNNPGLTAERFMKDSWQLAVGSRQKEKEKTKKEIKDKIQITKQKTAKEPEKGQPLELPGTAPQIKAFGSPEPFSRKGFWPSESPRRVCPTPRGGAGGGIFYRTGDLARWLDDGTVEFLGRRDGQVKIRGY
ncbi:MAG: amino acid adenylation domain-containing protein, partial [bacterium]|nr:amino acid adenylation domain-containing protein [bacterium]